MYWILSHTLPLFNNYIKLPPSCCLPWRRLGAGEVGDSIAGIETQTPVTMPPSTRPRKSETQDCPAQASANPDTPWEKVRKYAKGSRHGSNGWRMRVPIKSLHCLKTLERGPPLTHPPDTTTPRESQHHIWALQGLKQHHAYSAKQDVKSNESDYSGTRGILFWIRLKRPEKAIQKHFNYVFPRTTSLSNQCKCYHHNKTSAYRRAYKAGWAADTLWIICIFWTINKKCKKKSMYALLSEAIQ